MRQVADLSQLAESRLQRQRCFNLAYPCLDFARLDTKPTYLYLMVGTSDVFDIPVTHPAHEIAGPVEPYAVVIEGIGEAFRRQAGASEIAPCQTIPADVQLTDFAHGYELQVVIKHIGCALADRTPDRRVRAIKAIARLGLPDQWRDNCLGGPVSIDENTGSQGTTDQIVGSLGHGFPPNT